jgi:hypothetical protein
VEVGDLVLGAAVGFASRQSPLQDAPPQAAQDSALFALCGRLSARRASVESTPFQIYRVADDVSGLRLALGEGRAIGRDVRDPEATHVLPLARAPTYVYWQRLPLRLFLDLAHLRVVG